jgi:hypothetical protein
VGRDEQRKKHKEQSFQENSRESVSLSYCFNGYVGRTLLKYTINFVTSCSTDCSMQRNIPITSGMGDTTTSMNESNVVINQSPGVQLDQGDRMEGDGEAPKDRKRSVAVAWMVRRWAKIRNVFGYTGSATEV